MLARRILVAVLKLELNLISPIPLGELLLLSCKTSSAFDVPFVLRGQLSELKIIELTELICDADKNEGDWIQWLDIVESGSQLKVCSHTGVHKVDSQHTYCISTQALGWPDGPLDHLTVVSLSLLQIKEYGYPGNCQTECKTIEKACQEVRMIAVNF